MTTTVDWSHGLQTVDHAEAAVDALQEVPGRFVLAYGNIQQGPWEWATSPDFRRFVERRFGSADDMLGLQMAFDVTGDPAFPEQEAFKVARELGVPVTTHAGVWGATNDDGIRLMHEHGFMTPENIYVHAATLEDDSYHRIAATGGSVSVSTESEQSAGQGYPPTWRLRAARHPGLALHGHQRVVERRPVLRHARDARRGPLARAPRGARAAGHRDQPPPARGAGRRLGDPRRQQGARPRLADREPRGRQEGRRRADQERRLAGDVPAAAPVRPRGVPGAAGRRPHGARRRPRGEARRQAGRRRPAARARRAVDETVDFAMRTLGEEAWTAGMHPEIPERTILENPYQYTEWDAGSAKWKR